MHLSALDAVVVALYVAAILALGFSARLRDSSLLQYLVAGRSLSLPAFVATLVSTWYGGILAIGDAVKSFGVGTLLLYGVPYYAFAIFYALWLAPRVRGAEQISLPERLHLRWGRGAGLVGAVLVFLLAVPAAHVLMLGVLVQLLTGWQLWVAVIVATFGGTLFLYRGGLLADVRASLLAFAGMYVGFLVIAIWCLTHYSPAWLHDRLVGLSGTTPYLSPTGGQGILAIASFFILGAWTLVDPGFHQRVASAASPELGRRGVLVSTVCWFVFDILSLTTGLYALALLPSDASGLSLFPVLGDRVLPAGLKALFLCGLLGTILSAMVGYTLVSGATFGRELVARLYPSLSEGRVKDFTRLGFGIACVVAVTLALNVRNVAVDLWYAYSGAVVGALLLPVLIAYSREKVLRGAPGWVSASMSLAFLTSFAWIIWSKRTGNAYFMVYLAGQEFSLGTLVPGLLVSALVLGLGEVVGRRGLHDG